MRNTTTASRTNSRMRKSIVLVLFLLALWAESSHVLPSKNKITKETDERVLIRSKRRWVLSTFELEEESLGPFPQKVTELHNDRTLTYSVLFSISGQGVNEDPRDVFTVNAKTGELFVHKPIDREKYPIFHVNFDVMDEKTGEILDKTLAFNVAINDKNDNPPVFIPEVLYVKIPENVKEGQLPVSLQAKDNDEKDNDNSRIAMRIVSQEPALPKITLDSFSDLRDSMIMKLAFTGCFDYDKVKEYKLLVEAKDHGTPSLSSTTTVNIQITDSNTHPPVFTAPVLNAKVMEMETNKEILRMRVRDEDTPNTPGSRPVFKILKGNEEGNYKIETDPVTNEGVLTVIKGKDYERTTLAELEIGVENEEPLFVCNNWKPVSAVPKEGKVGGTAKVSIKVIDVNDPPVFKNTIQSVFKVEEEDPGEVLYTPIVTDEDSDPNKIRYELVEDPAKWVSIDPKTGKITLVKKMDRESPYVHNSTYTVVMRAIDNGEPPGTGTGTLVIHLGDKNDNTPRLTSNTTVMCGNKADRGRVTADDADVFPFGGPFTFTLGKDDVELKRLWRFDPSTGAETSLVSLTSLPYGTYTVPLKIADQQGVVAQDVLHVVVCNCGKGDVCQGLLPRSSSLHRGAIGILLGALFLLALLLCLFFFCECKEKKNFKQALPDDGNQTLIIYNEEGGGSLCKSDLKLQSPTSFNQSLNTEMLQFDPQFQQNTINHYGNQMLNTTQLTQVLNGNDTTNSRNSYAKTMAWTRSRNSTNGTTTGNRFDRGFSRSFSSQSEWNVEEQLERMLRKLSNEQQDFPEYQPRDYSSEGADANDETLDKLSFHSKGDDLEFLQTLGPKFSTLDEICHQGIKENNIKFK
ncbi:cadherin-like protein 26 [Silurus meridionalis]|uniref:Cadherin domain-containing protein n=1 Tax=Silurus meridionalis TaxID=175797 RepID=A0A8T0ARY9_SILME|nr:cadherin-like protein 26 [Silurus meridionalis]KAF7695857.1 hypothetical protein HF521_005951 [Silurus meridionalis]